MFKTISNLFSFLKERLGEKGQGMVEYALILAAVAIIAVVAIWGGGSGNNGKDLKSAITGAFQKAATEVTNAQKDPSSSTGDN